MNRFTTLVLVLLTFLGTSLSSQDLVISGVVDGPLPGGLPKAIEVYAINNISDLSNYGLGSANNGQGSDGEEFTFPSDAATAGDYIYVASESTEFSNFFGFAPNYESDAANINGDDAIELFLNGNVIDVFGDINQDGSGEPWEYLDGWVYRIDGTGPDGTNFVLGNFSYSGVDIWGGATTNSEASIPFPIGTYTAGTPTQVATPIISPPSGDYVNPIDVSITCGTEDATIYYTTDGSDPDESDTEYSTSFQISVSTTVKARAYKAGLDPSSIATNNYNFPTTVQVANIAELRSQSVGGGDYFELTGEAILTFQQSFRGQKYIQDATAAILIDDDGGAITTNYEINDGITGITGELSEFGGMLQFVPITDPGAASSSGNNINPQVISLSDLLNNFEDFEAELVRVEGCVFDDAGSVFEVGTVYPITDGSKANYNFRTTFYDVDYIGEEIPLTTVDLILLPNSRSDGEYATSRSQSDIIPSSSNPATDLDITDINGGANVYENQPFTVKVQAFDEDGNPAIVDSDVSITLDIGTGSGTLSGTINGTITSGSSSVILAGVLYAPHENGVVLTVSGGGLNSGDSDPFDVLEVVIPELLFSEVMYKALPGEDTLEYIEIYNNGSSAINLQNYEMTQGVSHIFESFVLDAGDYVLLAKRADIIQDVLGVSAIQWNSGGLSNGGEDIELVDAEGNVVAYIDYLSTDPWPTTETGRSIRFCDYELAQNNGENWSNSTEFISTYNGIDLYGTPLSACGNDPDPLVADFVSDPDPAVIDLGSSIDFTDLSTGDPTAWNWTFEGGTPETSITQNPQDIVYNAAGTYNVELTITRGGDSDTETKVGYVTVNDPTEPPVAGFVADVTTIFVGQSVQFTDQSQNNPTAFLWTFEGGTPATSTNQDPLVTYNAPGTYDVTLFVENSAGNDELTQTDYITVLPATIGDIVITEIMYNPPESGTDSLEYIEIYNNSSDQLNLLGYAFTAGVEFVFPDVNIGSGEYLLIAANAAAIENTFGLEAIQWTAGGLSNNGELIRISSPTGITIDSVSYETASPWPEEADGGGPSLAICDPETENAVGENWHASVNYLATNENGDDIFGSPLTYPAPVANFVANQTELGGTGTVEFTELSICNATSFDWFFEGGSPESSTDPNPTIAYNIAGDFDVTLTVSNETGSHTFTIENYIQVGVGLNEIVLENIEVIPNPSNGIFRLMNPSQEKLNITVYSILGAVVLEEPAFSNENLIDLSDQESGIYFLRMQIGDEVRSIKLIKK
jgi:PKD repeat protein